MAIELEGTVVGVFLGDQEGSLASTPRDQIQLTLDGIIGDNHYGATKLSDSRTPYYPRGTIIRNSRQVSILSVEDLEEIARRMGIPSLSAEWLGANILVRGIPNLTLLPPTSSLFFQREAVLIAQAENMPCKGPGKMIQSHYPHVTGLDVSFPKLALHLRGIVAWVERPGIIAAGDSLRVKVAELLPYKV